MQLDGARGPGAQVGLVTVDADGPSSPGTAIDADLGAASGAIAAPALPAGAVLARRYLVVRLLGRGGTGAVYEAMDTRLGMFVALKLLHRGRDREIERLRRELLLARKVSHPAVCRVFDLERHDDDLGARWFLTMELLRGESLRDRVSRCGRLASPEVVEIADALLAGLEAAHAAGVVHRDLTSANVLLVPRAGRVSAVITDFGLAVDDQVAPDQGGVHGTPAYMAPEQAQGQRSTLATDVFGLAVVLYEALTGERPWPDRAAAQRHRDEARRARGLVPELPIAWDAALARALSLDPARRFGDARAFRIALAGSRRHRRMRWGAAAALCLAAFVARGDGSEPSRVAAPVVADLDGAVSLAFAVGGGAAIVEGVAELASGDLVITGHTYAPFAPRGVALGDCPVGHRCGFVARLSPAAVVRWARAFGGGGDVSCHGLALDGDRVIVGGKLTGPAAFAGAGPTVDGFVLSLALDDGATRWLRRLDAPGARVRSVAVDRDGNVYASGDASRALVGGARWTADAAAPLEAVTGLLVALDRAGAPRWTRWLGGRGHARWFAVGVASEVVLWGGGIDGPVHGPDVDLPAVSGRALALALDRRTGVLRWAQDIASTQRAHLASLAVDRDGTAVLAGWFIGELRLGERAVQAAGSADGWVARIDVATGAPRWLSRVGGERWDSLVSVAVADRAIWVAGRRGGETDNPLDPRAAREDAALVVALSPDGASQRVWSFGGEALAKGRVVAAGRSGLWLAGNFRHTMSAGAFLLRGEGINDGFVMRLAASEAPWSIPAAR